MDQKYTVDENGITVKKLFKSILVPYTEILSIVVGGGHNYVNTRSGESYDIDPGFSSVTVKCPILFKYIEEYNIDFKDMDEVKDGQQTYTYEEALQIAKRTEEQIKKYACNTIAMQMGKDYSIETRFYDKVDTFSGVDLILVKDGKAVELPPELKDFYDKEETGAFDQMDLFYGPVLWDAEHSCARYGITEECRDDTICERTVFECVTDLCVRYKREINS